MLRHHGIRPYVVFDGDRLPSKARTEEDREVRRTENLARAEALMREGRQSSAFEAYAKCLDITPEIAYQLIKTLQAEGVDYVVAPYEADAQLAYLERIGEIDAIVTEDSDLLVFGCRKVLFKMDSNGDCIEILQSRFTACKTLSFAGWTSDLFRQMAILSGCDYLPSISGMGLKNAHKLLQRYKTVRKVLQAVRLEGKMRIPADYQQQFEQAEKTFLHQRVWCPRKKELTTLSPLLEGTNEELLDYIGPHMATEVARGIAEGHIDPISRKAMVDIMPSHQPRQRAGTAGPLRSAGAFRRAPSGVKSQQSTPSRPAGQKGIDSFFGKAPLRRQTTAPTATSSVRKPLASRDVNAINLETAAKSPPAATVSRFFNKKSKSTPNAKELQEDRQPTPPSVVEDMAEDLEASESPLPPMDVDRQPIPGMADYFFELDGVDPRLLIPEEEDVEGSKGSEHQEDRSELGFTRLTCPTAASFDEDGTEESSFDWAMRNGCDSELSDAHSTPEKNRLQRSSSIDFASPQQPRMVKKLANDVQADAVELREVCNIASTNYREEDDHDDIVSSPDRGRTPKIPLTDEMRSLSPVSPLQARTQTATNKRKRGQPAISTRKSLAMSPDNIEPPDDQDENDENGMTPVGMALWAKFSHSPTEETPSRPSKPSTTSSRPRSVLRTPASRPLRLYSTKSPPESDAFQTPAAGVGESSSRPRVARTASDKTRSKTTPHLSKSISTPAALSLGSAPRLTPMSTGPPTLQRGSSYNTGLDLRVGGEDGSVSKKRITASNSRPSLPLRRDGEGDGDKGDGADVSPRASTSTERGRCGSSFLQAFRYQKPTP